MQIGGFAAAHSGKPVAFRGSQLFLSRLCLWDRYGGVASSPKLPCGKPEAYRYVLRRSRERVLLNFLLPALDDLSNFRIRLVHRVFGGKLATVRF